jgi:hypothetical protein
MFNLMKTSIVNILNILFTLVIFTPFVYTQTTNKFAHKHTNEKTIIVRAAGEQPKEQVHLINTP